MGAELQPRRNYVVSVKCPSLLDDGKQINVFSRVNGRSVRYGV
jgi:hypothetical protein